MRSFARWSHRSIVSRAVAIGVIAAGLTWLAPVSAGAQASTPAGVASPSSQIFTNDDSTDGLGSDFTIAVYAVDDTVYAATFDAGLSISRDGGATFPIRSTGLASVTVRSVYAVGSRVYAGTDGGVSVSSDGGLSFSNYTAGLGSNSVYGVYAIDDTVYAATTGGLSISTDGGANFTNRTTTNGLGSNSVYGVYAVGSTVYAATNGGVSISTNGGTSFTNYTTGLRNISARGVYAIGSTVYAATIGGLSISTNGGTTFTTGLDATLTLSVFAIGSTVYAATYGGLSISTNGGSTFTNYTTADGLGSNAVYGVFTTGSRIYAATEKGLSIAALPTLTAVAAAPGQNTASVSWTVDDTGGSALTGIEFALDDTVTVDDSTTNTTGPHTLVGLTNGQTYTVYARAVNALGAGPWSTPGATVLPLTFTNRTTTRGLGSNRLTKVYAVDDTVYAATNGSGLSISTDGGNTFTNKTKADGLGSNTVFGVYAVGPTVYAATIATSDDSGGLSISSNGGATFTNRTTVNGLGSDSVFGVYAVDDTVYAATAGGLSISTDGGATYSNKLVGQFVTWVFAVGSTVYASTYNGVYISIDGGDNFTNYFTGLGSNYVTGVYAVGSTVYAATIGGLSISTNGGAYFTNYTTANGLGNNIVNGVYAIGSTVYAATSGGLSISLNGGATFANYTTSNGLGSKDVQGVFAIGSTVYVATSQTTAISPGGLSMNVPAPPLAPSAIAATPGDDTASVSWTVDDTGGSALTRIEFALDDTTTIDDSTTNTTGPHTLTGLANGQTYTVYVRAVNATGAGPWSTGTPVTPRTTPGLLTSIAATPGNDTASMSWTVDDTGGLTLTQIEFAIDDTTTVDDSTTNTTGPHTLVGLTNGDTYTVYVRAVNAAGDGPWSTGTPVTPQPPPTPPGPVETTPGAPRAVAAAAGNASASIVWSAPESPGSFPISTYEATASPGGDTCLVTELTCTITGLTNATDYTFTVRALNGAGWGPWSTPSATVTPTAPATPTVVITGTRGQVRGKPGILITGTSTAMGPGAILRPWLRFPGQTTYTEGTAQILIDTNGTFTWQRTTGKKTYLYLTTPDTTLRSNRIIIPAP